MLQAHGNQNKNQVAHHDNKDALRERTEGGCIRNVRVDVIIPLLEHDPAASAVADMYDVPAVSVCLDGLYHRIVRGLLTDQRGIVAGRNDSLVGDNDGSILRRAVAGQKALQRQCIVARIPGRGVVVAHNNAAPALPFTGRQIQIRAVIKVNALCIHALLVKRRVQNGVLLQVPRKRIGNVLIFVITDQLVSVGIQKDDAVQPGLSGALL